MVLPAMISSDVTYSTPAGVCLVWLKRDLRLSDHEPLLRASQSGLPVLLLYIIEPVLLSDPHYDLRHWRFIRQSIQAIQQRIPQSSLLVLQGHAVEVLSAVRSALAEQGRWIEGLFSHEETGLFCTFQRDLRVRLWCDQHHIPWQESQSGAVIRALSSRERWDRDWQKVMKAPLATSGPDQILWFNGAAIQCAASVIPHCFCWPLSWMDNPAAFQIGGEQQALQVLHSFFDDRGRYYHKRLSSPLLSQDACSRLSPYLAWGCVSLRQCYQVLLQHWTEPGWRRALSALSSRLHWHCHFIQKFESECRMETEHINRGYQAFPFDESVESTQKLRAWQQGQTGYPMVDACMQALKQTGYINFRMRAMLVSFLCHHLLIDWRRGVHHLARYFLDFEPGIHYAQFQMQAGVTGINTLRIYNPVKQSLDQDAAGVFIRQWLPALRDLPDELVHQPWQMTPMEQQMFSCYIGRDYPEPVVDITATGKAARTLLWQWRNRPDVKAESQRILQRHVRVR